MPVSPAIRRLLGIRELQEEQRRSALESALRELEGLKAARAAASKRAQSGRHLVAESTRSGELPDRWAGLQEECNANAYIVHLGGRIGAAEQLAAAARERYLAARLERRQAETIAASILEQDALQGARKIQKDLDEWFRSYK